MVVVVVRSLLDLPLGFRNNVSQSNVVFNVFFLILTSKAHFQSVVSLTLEHHGADVIARGQMGVDHPSAAAATARTALATNVHGVAQVSARRAVADVIIWILLCCVMVVVGHGVGGFLRPGRHNVIGWTGAACTTVFGSMLLLLLMLMLLLLWRR